MRTVITRQLLFLQRCYNLWKQSNFTPNYPDKDTFAFFYVLKNLISCPQSAPVRLRLTCLHILPPVLAQLDANN